MLPDLRIVIAAVISTFVLTVGVGFYASSRLIAEPRRAADSIAAFEETPVNRIALSWPEPTRQSEPLALDFAVTARALRNPVRDVTNETAPADQQSPPMRTAATDPAMPPSEKPAQAAPAQIEAAPAQIEDVPAQVEAVPAPIETAPVVTEAPQPEPMPEPEIRVAVQYPPVLELPPELRARAVAPPAAAAPIADTPATTGSLTVQPKISESALAEPALAEPVAVVPAPRAATAPETKIASRPEPAEIVADDDPEIEAVPLPKPAPKTKAKKAAPKKAAPRRIVRRPVRRTVPSVPNTVPNFFGLFTFQQRR